jgi:arylamine N-acetyltransferase
MKNSWQQSYLNYLGIAESSPDLNYLTLLTNTHLRRIPYETVSKFVTIDRIFYYTDVGYGAPLFTPLRLKGLSPSMWRGNYYYQTVR